MLRIGIEAFRVFRKFKHGIDISSIELIRRLQQTDRINQYYIFVLDDRDDTCIHETENFQIVRIPHCPLPFAEQFLLPILSLYFKLDKLHSTGNTSPVILPCKRIVTIHDIIYLEKNPALKGGSLYQRLGKIYRHFIVPNIINKCESIITVSKYEKETIINKFPHLSEKIQVITNSCGAHFKIKPLEQTRSTLLRYNLPTDGFILVLGNTDPKKNVSNLLKALYILKKENKLKYKVVITDLSWDYIHRKIHQYSLDDLDKDLIMTGYISNTDMPDLYNNARLFIYPSLRESFGIPILEALSCGCTVLTSNTSAMPDTAGKAAFYANPENENEIATGIYKALSEGNRRQVKKDAALIQIKKFSWKKSAELLYAVYTNMPEEAVRFVSTPY